MESKQNKFTAKYEEGVAIYTIGSNTHMVELTKDQYLFVNEILKDAYQLGKKYKPLTLRSTKPEEAGLLKEALGLNLFDDLL